MFRTSDSRDVTLLLLEGLYKEEFCIDEITYASKSTLFLRIPSFLSRFDSISYLSYVRAPKETIL